LITSITMNGGTSLRTEAESRSITRSLSVASPMDICYFNRQIGRPGGVPPVPVAPVRAEQGKGPAVLRDSETEQLLREYTRPILRVAGLEKQNIQMVIINDGTFNA